MQILQLFTTFFRIGAFTFGGGYAMIPLIKHELVEKKKWMAEQDILDIVTISESSPGPFAVNAATFVGYRVAGFWGAFFATLGVVVPSFVIIVLISLALEQFEHIKVIKYAFWGIRAGVLASILKAFWNLFRQCPKEWLVYTVALAAFLLATFTPINMFYIIVLGGLIGVVTYLFSKEKTNQQTGGESK